MGSSLSCLCPNDRQSTTGDVLVMKEDGEFIGFSHGTLVKHVLSSYPSHKLIQCRSDRSVLPDSHRMSCNRLYFLLPEGLAECDATYDCLVRAAASKGMVFSREGNRGGDRKMSSEFEGGAGDGPVGVGKALSFDYFGCTNSNSPWRPSLQTIPEVISPPLHANL